MDYQVEENPVVVVTLTDPVTRATQRLRELQARGVELYEILGGEAGATFIRDACERGTPRLHTQPSPWCTFREPTNAG